MSEKIKKKKLAILRTLRGSTSPLSSSKIAEHLLALGMDVSERTVRLYLKELDQEGLTENLGKRGRRITRRGAEELQAARAYDKVGLLAAKIDKVTYGMDFDLETRKGNVVVNTALVRIEDLQPYVSLVQRVFDRGYAMGRLLTLRAPGERLGTDRVPIGMVGIGTVCSITLNGVLLSQGIPVSSKFGGLLELRENHPTRFVEIIYYSGTTIDPLEVFIRSGMTDYIGAVMTGSGRIGAGLREVPAESRSRVVKLAEELEEAGLGGFLKIGLPGEPILEIPINEERVGVVVIGGLNPMAILEENGVRVRLRALDGLAAYESLFDYRELADRLCGLSRPVARSRPRPV